MSDQAATAIATQQAAPRTISIAAEDYRAEWMKQGLVIPVAGHNVGKLPTQYPSKECPA